MLDPIGPMPVYQQIAEILAGRIDCGELRLRPWRANTVLRAKGVRQEHGTFVIDAPKQVQLRLGGRATSAAALTATRAIGEVETYPSGTTLAVAGRAKHA